MTWQLLIWNIFVWGFTGTMIYVKDASMWWLLLAAIFTGTQNAFDLYKSKMNDEEPVEIDPATQKKVNDMIDSYKRGKL